MYQFEVRDWRLLGVLVSSVSQSKNAPIGVSESIGSSPPRTEPLVYQNAHLFDKDVISGLRGPSSSRMRIEKEFGANGEAYICGRFALLGNRGRSREPVCIRGNC